MGKKIVFIVVLALLPVLFLQGCRAFEKELSALTNSFLESYFKVDYLTAGTFCCDSLAKDLAESLKSMDSLEPSVKEMLIKKSSEVKTEILSVERANSRDTAKVTYTLMLPDYPFPVENRILFAKSGKEWKIVSLGR